ncbi:hypothetical protein JI435_160080 [Parastagonospora nodorum SN15]|uniref:Uncharacterized protein n=1 Tax=Phaeosphaeria nodorum (strain SN15 / ATCC MYA-4574 / FGSC 10173) TaxID=321614 RepID=A0A7U2FIC6_PHANO|nr:hypothetical protein JI435_160080 [Parastagonospora nodorum SN15]
MLSFSRLAVLALPLFGTVFAEEPASPTKDAAQPNSIYSSAQEAFHDLLNALPEESLQAALSGLKDFQKGVFESHHRGVEQVHDKNPALATKLIVAAVQDLKKRQTPSNGTSASPPPQSSAQPPSKAAPRPSPGLQRRCSHLQRPSRRDDHHRPRRHHPRPANHDQRPRPNRRPNNLRPLASHRLRPRHHCPHKRCRRTRHHHREPPRRRPHNHRLCRPRERHYVRGAIRAHARRSAHRDGRQRQDVFDHLHPRRRQD